MFYRFILTSLPAWILSIGFLYPARWRPYTLFRFALLTGFALWFWLSPPSFIQVYGPIRRGEKVGVYAATHLVMHMVYAGRDNPAANILPLVRGRKAAVYATGPAGWTPGACRDVVNVELAAWQNGHFFQPFDERCGRGVVWEDRHRHRQMHERFTALGREGLQRDFVDHVESDLENGRDVWIVTKEGDDVLKWLREDLRFAVEPAAASGIWSVRIPRK